MSSQTVGQFPMDFGPKDRHVTRCSEAQLYPISVNFQHDYFDVLANEDSLTRFSAKNQHVPSLKRAVGHFPHFDAITTKPVETSPI
jgi:hypothetical protein